VTKTAMLLTGPRPGSRPGARSADARVLTPGGVTASVLALRDGSRRVPADPAPRWEHASVAALQRAGLDLQPWKQARKEPDRDAAHAVS
jgi:hypothetical protein